MKKPAISKTAFWDVNFEIIDFETNSLFVMTKVFNHGTFEDMLGVFRFYGLERIKIEIVNAAYLKKKVLAFLCVILHLKETDFENYQKRQARKPIWDE
jgi:hypothetical protein